MVLKQKGRGLAPPLPAHQPFVVGVPSLFGIMDSIMRLQLRAIFCCISLFIIMPGIIPP
jgi:hypothetical protein